MSNRKESNNTDQQACVAAANAARRRGWKAFCNDRGQAVEWRHKDYGLIMLQRSLNVRRWYVYPKGANGACMECNYIEKAFRMCEDQATS